MVGVYKKRSTNKTYEYDVNSMYPFTMCGDMPYEFDKK